MPGLNGVDTARRSSNDLPASKVIMPSLVMKILDRDAGVTRPLELLSLRQREILQMIAGGQSTKEISYRLNLSAKTVETHRRVRMQRFDIHEVAGLARFAVRSGFVALER